ncbi:hypothetical protein C5S32_00380 [ANME-1 cluster archaeon GoMg1]|nr:hypothetical protein [ANME-1 cluster archaeon GoMg1]
MAKLGSKKRPAVVRVRSMARTQEILKLCTEHGWQVVAGVEPDKPEDISDVKKLLKSGGTEKKVKGKR